jgi:hypothetical protein
VSFWTLAEAHRDLQASIVTFLAASNSSRSGVQKR